MKKLVYSLLFALGSLDAMAGPNIQATPGSLTGFQYTSGSGPSASQAVLLQSSIMAISSGTVTVTSPSGYEVSLNNSTFSGSVSIPYSGDTLAPTNLYVRMKAGLAAGDYTGQTIALAATGISKSITTDGFVSSPCTVTTGTVTATTAAFTWTSSPAATGYEYKIDQIMAAPTGAGTPITTNSYSASGLTANTNYYMHVRTVGPASITTPWTTKAFSTKPTGIANSPALNGSINIAPNPSHGAFTVKGSVSGGDRAINIRVFNVLGQVVYSTVAVSEKGSFSKGVQLGVPSGAYMVSVSADNSVMSSRVVIN